MGNPEEGRAYFKQALKEQGNMDPTNADDAYTYSYWAKAEEQFGDKAKADEHKRRASQYIDKVAKMQKKNKENAPNLTAP